MFCSNCGEKNKEDAVFCVECGQKITPNSNQNTTEEPKENNDTQKSEKNIFKDGNWFKIALVLVIPVTAIVLVYGFVIYPENIRKEEREAAERQQRIDAALAETREQERAENLKTCLDESESQETYAHLSYCGDNGRSANWCSSIYGGAENVLDVIDNYRNSSVYEDMTLEETFDECNCSLEGWIREGFEEDKTERDTLCYSLYSN